jgi:hypothetical protein
MQNNQNFTQNLSNLPNMEDFYQKMSQFGGQMGSFDEKIADFKQKMGQYYQNTDKKK